MKGNNNKSELNRKDMNWIMEENKVQEQHYSELTKIIVEATLDRPL